jgi:uncharacterized protein (DUF488 family)
MKKIVTIGAYGFDREKFLQALVDAGVDTFCDIRLRRGMRGAEYAFANSQRLQKDLCELHMKYIHIKELAPTRAIREKQNQEDKKLSMAKRAREILAQSFIDAYEKERLSHFDSQQFLAWVGSEANIVCLFCVERKPDACHRSLVARQLSKDLSVPVEDILP